MTSYLDITALLDIAISSSWLIVAQGEKWLPYVLDKMLSCHMLCGNHTLSWKIDLLSVHVNGRWAEIRWGELATIGTSCSGRCNRLHAWCELLAIIAYLLGEQRVVIICHLRVYWRSNFWRVNLICINDLVCQPINIFLKVRQAVLCNLVNMLRKLLCSLGLAYLREYIDIFWLLLG